MRKPAIAKKPAAPQPSKKSAVPTPSRAPKPNVGAAPPRQDGDSAPMALDLPQGELSPAMLGYFEKCREKIGFVPHVLTSYAHDNAKLEAFAAFYNDLMLGPSGLSKLEREMIAVV